MRCSWLFALLAAALVASTTACDPSPDEPPTEAEAPTPERGQITFATIARTATDGFINQAECRSGTIRLKAQTNTGANVVQYQLFAANDKANTDTSPAAPVCETDDADVEGGRLIAGSVDELRSGSDTINGAFILNADYATSLIVAAAGKAACDATAAGDIILCFQAKNASLGNVGTARVRLTLVIDKPSAPDLQSVTPGGGALNVNWDVTNPRVNESYAVEVGRQVDPADPASVVTITSPRVFGTELRFEGLTNGTTYNVQVRAFSDADNPGDPSNAITASPIQVDDFWDAYQRQPGHREEGGCGTAGGAGLFTLLGLAGLAALRRRS